MAAGSLTVTSGNFSVMDLVAVAFWVADTSASTDVSTRTCCRALPEDADAFCVAVAVANCVTDLVDSASAEASLVELASAVASVLAFAVYFLVAWAFAVITARTRTVAHAWPEI
jgi:hypothetical protein